MNVNSLWENIWLVCMYMIIVIQLMLTLWSFVPGNTELFCLYSLFLLVSIFCYIKMNLGIFIYFFGCFLLNHVIHHSKSNQIHDQSWNIIFSPFCLLWGGKLTSLDNFYHCSLRRIIFWEGCHVKLMLCHILPLWWKWVNLNVKHFSGWFLKKKCF